MRSMNVRVCMLHMQHKVHFSAHTKSNRREWSQQQFTSFGGGGGVVVVVRRRDAIGVNGRASCIHGLGVV